MKQSRLSWRLSFWFNNGRDRERERSVPFNIRLDRLHLTIQAAMGWTNSHLYEIRADGVGWSTPYPDQDWAGDTRSRSNVWSILNRAFFIRA